MKLFTTEQVSRWHPDKAADQISDAIAQKILKKDENAHCGIETLVKGDVVVVAGETSARLNRYELHPLIEEEVQGVMDILGYPVEDIIDLVGVQSPEIKSAVDSKVKRGAGDQGMMYGFATNRTATMLPYGFQTANEVIHYLESMKKYIDGSNLSSLLQGDAKCLVTEDLDGPIYSPDDRIKRINISVCHRRQEDFNSVREIISEVLSDKLKISRSKIVVNPAGAWTRGGPSADCGLTGRKIVADQYGGYCAVGGGAFSGKDSTKVDRTAAYMARVIAKDVCQRYALDEAAVQLGYMIGHDEPVSVFVECDGKHLSFVEDYVKENYDLTPYGMATRLDFDKIDLAEVSAGCHYRPREWGGLG